MDPSELHRPEEISFAEKDLNKFRDFTVYENDPIKERIRLTYKQMHQNQTVEFVRGKWTTILLFHHIHLVETESEKSLAINGQRHQWYRFT